MTNTTAAVPLLSGSPLATALRIDIRRPAGWIALAAAGWSGWELAVAPRSWGVAAAVAAGSLLAVAAIGSPSTGVPRGGLAPWRALGLIRVGWPVAGFLVTGSLVATACALATALLVGRLLGRSSSPSGVTSLGLAIAGAAAAAALVVQVVGGGPATQVLAALAAWGLLAAGSSVEPALGPWEWQAGGPTTTRHRWPDAGHGLAMATSLAAMVGCFFLAPGLSWAYAALALGWFVCLAVPAVLDADPGRATARLLRAAAGRPLAPGTVARGLRTCAVLAAILGWPAVVACVLPSAEGGRVGSPLAALVTLAAASAAVLIAAATAAAAGGRADTPRAVVLALAALAAVHAAGGSGRAERPVLPHLPYFAGGGGRSIGVEPPGASCKTPQSTQPPGSSPWPPGLVEIRHGGAR